MNPCVFDEHKPCFQKFGRSYGLKSKYVLVCVCSQLQLERSEGIHTKIHIQPDSQRCMRASGCPGGGRLHVRLRQGHSAIRTAKTGTVLGIKLQRAWACRGSPVWWRGDKDGRSPCQLPLSHKAGTSVGDRQARKEEKINSSKAERAWWLEYELRWVALNAG